jgi:D-aspartate ligase
LTQATPPAILLGGSSGAVSAARALGRRGIEVHALGGGGWNPVQYSRFCRAFEPPNGTDVQASWLSRLRQRAPRGVLIPCSDDALELLARNRAELVELGYAPVEANDEVLLAMLDKARTYELAREHGVETPRTWTLRTDADLEAAAATIGFPSALKPLHSHVYARHVPIGKVVIVRTLEELREAFAPLREAGVETLLTEIVPGSDDRIWAYVTYLDESAAPLFEVVKRKVRQYLPHFGVGTLHVTDWDDEVAEVGLRFFRAIGLRGYAFAELKRDDRDGSLKLIEVNYRFGAHHELIQAAGIDAAFLVYERALGRSVAPLGRDYRRGVVVWHVLDDLRAFRLYRREGELSFAGWAASVLRPHRYAIFDPRDPGPTLVLCARLVRGLLSRRP